MSSVYCDYAEKWNIVLILFSSVFFKLEELRNWKHLRKGARRDCIVLQSNNRSLYQQY
jgi:hypothetical protein